MRFSRTGCYRLKSCEGERLFPRLLRVSIFFNAWIFRQVLLHFFPILSLFAGLTLALALVLETMVEESTG